MFKNENDLPLLAIEIIFASKNFGFDASKQLKKQKHTTLDFLIRYILWTCSPYW